MARSKKAALAVAAGVLALGAGVGVASFAAADPSATPSASSSAEANGSERHGFGGRGHGRLGAAYGAALAEKLGLEQAQVREALRTVRDALKPAAGTERPEPEEREAAFVEALAAELDVDQAKVQTAVDELQAERIAHRAEALQERLDAAVADGTLTQAEADAVTKAVEAGVIGGRGR